MNESNKKTLSRRQAVAGAGAVGALAAAAAALPLLRGEAEAPAAAAGAPQGKTGYQVTQHVLRYYETTRI